MTDRDATTKVIKGTGFEAVEINHDEFALTFDPGAHQPQELTVQIDRATLDILLKEPSRFSELVVPLMAAQGVQAR